MASLKVLVVDDEPGIRSGINRILRNYTVGYPFMDEDFSFELIDAATAILEPDGLLIFSNNLRRFRMDHDALADLEIIDISAETLPRDFARNPRIHNCWRIRWRDQDRCADMIPA